VSTLTHLADDLPALLTIHDIAALFRVQRTTAYARTRDPDFPDPLVISGSCYRWYTHEVLAYIDSRRAPKKLHLRRTSPPDAGRPPAATVPPPAVPRARTTRRQRRTSSAAPSDT
jgi:predicted DNA-binding transcriptional regulator AlpA